MKLRLKVNGVDYDVEVELLDGDAQTQSVAPPAAVQPPAASAPAPSPSAPAAGARTQDSPIPGTVIEVNVKIGQQIQLNDTVLVIDAMKMNTPVAATQAGTVREILVKAGDTVKMGQALIVFD